MKHPMYAPAVMVLLLVTSALAGCVGGPDGSPATVEVSVANDPSDGSQRWSSFKVTFQRVQVHESADAKPGDDGWRTLAEGPRSVNLLAVDGNGTGGFLASGTVPGGTYGALLLRVSDARATPADGGSTVDLDLRGKLLAPAKLTLPAGNTTGIVLDMDLEGNGTLEPADGDGAPRYTPYLDRIVLRRDTPDEPEDGSEPEAPELPTPESEPTSAPPEVPDVVGAVSPDPWLGGSAFPDVTAGTASEAAGELVPTTPRDSWQRVDVTSGAHPDAEEPDPAPEPPEPEPPAEPEPPEEPAPGEDGGTGNDGPSSTRDRGDDGQAVQRGVVVVQEEQGEDRTYRRSSGDDGDDVEVTDPAGDEASGSDGHEEEAKEDEEESAEGDEEEAKEDEGEDGDGEDPKKNPDGTTRNSTSDGNVNGTEGNTTEDGGNTTEDPQEDTGGDGDGNATDSDGEDSSSSDGDGTGGNSTTDGDNKTTDPDDDNTTTSPDNGTGEEDGNTTDDGTTSDGNTTDDGDSISEGGDGNSTEDGNTTGYNSTGYDGTASASTAQPHTRTPTGWDPWRLLVGRHGAA